MADFLLSVGVDVGLSYEQMKKDISNLVSDLNKTPPKIKVAFDIDQKAVESLRNQITAISKQLGSASTNTSSGSTRRKATAEIADIANEARRAANTQAAASKKAANAEKEHETSLRQVLNTYRELLAAMRTNQNAQVASTYSELVKQADLFGSALEIAEDKAISIDAALKQVGLDGSTAIENAKTALAAFRVEMEQTGSSGTINMSQMYSVIAQMQNLLNSNVNAANLSSYTVLQEQVRLFTNALQIASSGSISLSEALKQVGLDGSTAISDARTAMSAFRAELSGATFEEVKLTKDSEQYNVALNKINTLLAAVRNNTEKWTAAKKGSSSADYETYSQQAGALEKLANKLASGTLTTKQFNKEYSKIKATINSAATAIKAAGEDTQTWAERIKNLSEKFSTWFSITQVIMGAYRVVRKMVSAVVELDTAMTELKKVTDETDSTYERFLVNAATRAKQLGATLSDTVTATADFARLGYGIEDAEKLADAAIIYKNVGDGIKDISEASESIIATMQAYSDEINPEDVMLIVDKFNEVGNNYAISSEGVGEALLRSAAAMHAANNSLDETIALATAANTIVQDPEKVGTTLKTVSMYLRAAKTEAEEAGEATDGMATSVSELRKDILALTNNKVDIQIDEDTFKSTYQILKELSAEWDNLTDITKANILEMVGGKRNSNVVAALLDNFTVAENALETSANAAGSALAENEKYLDSIQGRISIFKASFEEFSNNLISSGIVKFFVSVGTALMNALNTLVKIHALLPTIVGTLTIIKGISLSKTIAESSAKVATLSASLVAEKAATTELARSVAMLTLQEKQRLALNIQNAVASGQITAQEGTQILSTLGLATAEGTLTVANKTLGASFKSLMASIPVWGWIALAVSVVIEGVIALTNWIDSSSVSIADLDSELDSLTSTANTAADKFANLKSDADEIIPRFAELAKGVNDLGENVSLTDEEYEEFWELNNKVAEMFPELDAGIDSNGNHILTLSYSIDTLTESLNALLEAERVAANENIASNMGDALKNMKSADKQYNKEKKTLQQRVDAYKEASDEINRMYREQNKYKEAYGDRWQEQYRLDTERYVTQMQQAFGSPSDQSVVDAWQKMVDKYEIPDGDYGAIDWHAVINSDEFKNQMSVVEREMDSIEKKQTARWQKMNPIMGAWLQTTDSYAAAEDNVQVLLSKVIGNIDYSKIGITNEKKLKEYVQTNFVDPIADAKPEVQNAMVGLFDIKSAFDSGALTVGEYGITDYILGDLQQAGINDNILSNLKVSLNLDEFNKQIDVVKGGITGTDEEVKKFIDDLTYNDFSLVYSVISENGTMSIDELQEKIKQLRYESAAMVEPLNFTGFLDGLDAAADGVDRVVSAMEKLTDGTALTKKEMIDLIAKYPELLQQADIFADGSVEAQKNALNSILDMQEQEYDAQIDAKIAELEATEQVLDDQLELEEQKANLINDIKNMEVNGKVTQEEEFLNKLNEFNDLQGQNFVSLADGEVQVNEEALNDQLKQGADFGEESAENIWEPLGQTIVSSHEQGYTGSLTATNNYTTSLWGRIKNFFSNMGSAIANAWNDMWSGNWQGIGAYFSQAVGTGTGTISGGTVSVNFGGSATTINGTKVDDWVSQQEKASQERISKINKIKADTINAISNLENLKGLKLTDIYASDKSSKSGKDSRGSRDSRDSGDSRDGKDTKSDEENIFKTMYNYHKHLVEMEQETTAEFLKWLDDAYKAAYKAGEITLDEYYRYEEEVFKGMETLRKNAKDAIDDLIDYRIDMLKKDIDNEKDALDKKLKYLKDFYDKQKEMLQDVADEEEYLSDQQEKRKSIIDIQAELDQLQYDDSAWAQKRKLELNQELSDAQKELDDFEKDHALDLALDAIDNAYNSREAQIQAEMDALEEKLNDPNALYNQALADIKNNSKNQLYYMMLMYNRQYGDGKDETVKELWEKAYGALDEYQKMFGSSYNDITLKNETGYEAKKDSSANKESTQPDKPPSNSSSSKPSTSQSNAPSLSKGSSITVKKTATHFSSKSRGVRMASFVPGGTYTVYQTKGNEVLIGRNGVYTGWINKSDIVGYATGTKKATAGLHSIDELGTETTFESKDGVRYKLFTGGEKVLNAKASDFLYEFANGGGEILKKIIRSALGGSLLDTIQPVIRQNEINMGDIIVRGNADQQTVSAIRREQRSAVETMLKEFNKLNK